MRKYIALVLALVCVLGLVGCGQQEQQEENEQDYFNGTVLEVHDTYVLVECLEVTSGVVAAGEQTEVSTNIVTAAGTPELAEGDNIRVVFDTTEDTIPIRVGTLAIYLLDENGEVIFPE